MSDKMKIVCAKAYAHVQREPPHAPLIRHAINSVAMFHLVQVLRVFCLFYIFFIRWLLRILEWHTRSCWHSSSCFSFSFYYFPNLLPTSKVIDSLHFRALSHTHTTVFAWITTQNIYTANNTKRIAAIVALQHTHTHWYVQTLAKDRQWFFLFFFVVKHIVTAINERTQAHAHTENTFNVE